MARRGMVSDQHNGAEPRNGGDLFRAQATFSKRVINNAVEALKVIAEPMGEPSGDLLPFANGALDLKTGNFPQYAGELDHHAQRH